MPLSAVEWHLAHSVRRVMLDRLAILEQNIRELRSLQSKRSKHAGDIHTLKQ